jgi:quercetin dioxygenase-like cupin family protein
VNVIHLKDNVVYHEQFTPQILYVSPDLKVPLICLGDGQEIPPHPSGTGVFCVLDGNGTMVVEDKEIGLSAGEIVIAPEGSRRGIKAHGKIVAIAFHVSS